jgi:hypothetical protein
VGQAIVGSDVGQVILSPAGSRNAGDLFLNPQAGPRVIWRLWVLAYCAGGLFLNPHTGPPVIFPVAQAVLPPAIFHYD